MEIYEQIDLFESLPVTPETIQHAPIASKDDILKVQTAILFNGRTKPLEKIRAAELICKIQGYLKEQPGNHSDIIIRVEHVQESL